MAQPLPSNFTSLNVQRQAIAAQRVVAVRMRIGRLQLAEIARVAVVIDDHVAIKIFQVHD
jgi:hypothetical protein